MDGYVICGITVIIFIFLVYFALSGPLGEYFPLKLPDQTLQIARIVDNTAFNAQAINQFPKFLIIRLECFIVFIFIFVVIRIWFEIYS